MRHGLRRTQAVVPFGVGAIVDFRREALMAGGLDSWPCVPVCRVDDPRLARRLGVEFFREPPAADEYQKSAPALPFVRFPLWHMCPWCRALREAKWNDRDPPRCDSAIALNDRLRPCAALPERQRPRMVPLRFVVACGGGHIEDFPWVEWAHSKGRQLARANQCEAPRLRLLSLGRAGLEGLVVKCDACGEKKSMFLAGGPAGLKGLSCAGLRPWLGPDGNEDGCGATLCLLQRGATNIYFANMASSILIPPYTSRARIMMEDASIWDVLIDESLGPLGKRLETVSKLKKVALPELERAYNDKLSTPDQPAAPVTEEDFRFAEYAALLDMSRPPEEHLRLVPQAIGRYADWFKESVKDVVLVEKLAETRALTGFSRITPDMAAAAWAPKLGQLSLDPKPRWLPAIRVFGEGLFITLNRERLLAWSSTNLSRMLDLGARYRLVSLRRGRDVAVPPPSFFVLHTLAHALIRRLSFECGYGSSSLRERIFCREGQRPMAGVLIYTAAGDCEGTLGGLVSQGRPGRLESLLRAALDDARWCSSDPLCSESHGQGTDSLNLAACHACALLPETSCETGNRLLDRRCLVGSPEKPGSGYFADR